MKISFPSLQPVKLSSVEYDVTGRVRAHTAGQPRNRLIFLVLPTSNRLSVFTFESYLVALSSRWYLCSSPKHSPAYVGIGGGSCRGPGKLDRWTRDKIFRSSFEPAFDCDFFASREEFFWILDLSYPNEHPTDSLSHLFLVFSRNNV